MKIRSAAAFFACSALLLPAQNSVDVFSASKLKQLTAKLSTDSKKSGSAFDTLTRYGNHLTMIAHRDANGSSELHQKDADVFFIIEGDATLISGGKMVNAKTTAPNELRGSGIEGGTSQKLGLGDVVHIQPNVPHQLMVETGHTVTYFVVKVTQ